MSDWLTHRITDEYREIVNKETGAIKRVPFASEKQMQYIQSLRADLGKAPLKSKPPMYAAIKMIDKLVAKKKELGKVLPQERLL